MRILITGGAGFQGRALAMRFWMLGHDVTMFNTPSARALAAVAAFPAPVTRVWGSVTDPEVVTKAVDGKDVVMHLAAWANPDATIIDPLGSYRVNALGTGHVLEAVRKAGCRMIHASSCEVYGQVPFKTFVQDEDSPMNPATPYAAGKAAADRLCYAYANTYGLPVIILRPSNVYGPGQRSGPDGGVIPNFLECVRHKKPLTLRGTGEQEREWLFIDDLVAGYVAVLGCAFMKGQVFNLGSGMRHTIGSIAKRLAGRFPDLAIEYLPARDGDVVTGFNLDSSTANTVLGWRARTDFDTGLDKTITAVLG